MNMFLLALMLAITVEGLVEYAKSLYKLLTQHGKKALVLQLAALVSAVLLALLTGADFYSSLGVVFSFPLVGCILTGIFLSRGSNYLSDFVGKLAKTRSSDNVTNLS